MTRSRDHEGAPHKSDGIVSSMSSRHGLPVAMLLSFCLVILLVWQANVWYREQLLIEERARQAVKLSLYGNTLSILIDRNLALLEAMHAFAMAASSAGEIAEDFDAFAADLYVSSRGVRNFALAPAGVVAHVYPLSGNEKALGHDLLHDPATRPDAERAVRGRQFVLSAPYRLRQGGFGLVARKAVIREGAFWGLATVTLDLPTIFRMTGLTAPEGMEIALRGSFGQLLAGDGRVFAKSPVVQRVVLPDRSWQLAALPVGGWDAAIGRSMLFFRGSSIAIGGLLLALVYLFMSRQRTLTRSVNERTFELAEANHELRKEIAARGEAETALRRSEEHLRNLFELIPIGLALCSWDGAFKEVNPAFAAILGKTVPETLDLTYWEITPEKYLEQEKWQMESLEMTGRYGPFEKEFIHKEGHLVPVRLQGLVVRHEGERYIWSSVEDVTERNRLEAALKERNEQLALFVEHSPAAIAMFDRDMRYLIASRRWLNHLQIREQEVAGRSHYEMFPNMPAHWIESHRRCLAGQVQKSEQEQFVRPDGTVEWVRWEARPWYLRSGGIGGIILFLEDITPRVLAEEALRRERDFSDTLIDSLPGVVYLYDHNLKFLRWNRNLEQVLGYSAEQVACMSPLDFFAPESREIVRARIEEVFGTGHSSVEADFLSRDGRAIPYYFTGRRTDLNGIPCLLGVGIDISARKALENELLYLNRNLEVRVAERTRELQESRHALINLVEDLQETSEALHLANYKLLEVDRLKSMFIASMSHELRTPLNSVIGFTSVLLNEWVGPLNAEQKENLGIVLRAGRHLLSLINDVIDVSKIEAGQIEVHRDEFDLFDLIAEATGIMQKEIRDKGLDLRVENLHQVMHTDRARLLQCLLNLLSNAAKYTERGTVAVVARPALAAEEGGWSAETGYVPGSSGAVEIAVEDTGIGISEADRLRLFHPFVRLESHLRSVVTGTGLGLYLTRKIVHELLHGSIACESTPGAGSRFVLTVPVGDPAGL